jgi:hypothetical protein
MYPVEEYKIRCSQFTKVVDDLGGNKAWANRTVDQSEVTPIFLTPYLELLNKYIYNRADQPFGSSEILEEDFENDKAIYFRNYHFSDNLNEKQDSYAALPYGCKNPNLSEDDDINTCNNLGFCSNNPLNTCIVFGSDSEAAEIINESQCGQNSKCLPYFNSADEEGNVYTCSESDHFCINQCPEPDPDPDPSTPNVCQEVESNSDSQKTEEKIYECSKTSAPCFPNEYCPDEDDICEVSDIANIDIEPIPENGEDILRKLYLKSYAKKIFINSSWFNGYPYDYSFSADNEDNYTKVCDGNNRGGTDDCAVAPLIENIGLYKGEQEVPFNSGTGMYTIDSSDFYELKFNSIVDEEQLPLFDIFIDWGDGNKQIITDQDHRPDVESPHIIEHMYAGVEDAVERQIKIMIRDNWGYNTCCISTDCDYVKPPFTGNQNLPPQCPNF